jgi:Na+-driven multidrug efflux pump
MHVGSLSSASFLLCFTFAGETLSIYSRDALVIAAGAAYLKAYSWDCILVCFVFSMTGFFTGCGKTSFVMVQSLIGTFLVRIPFSAFMSRRPGVTMFQIGLAAPTASIVQILLCAVYLLSGKWRISSTERGSYGHSL